MFKSQTKREENCSPVNSITVLFLASLTAIVSWPSRHPLSPASATPLPSPLSHILSFLHHNACPNITPNSSPKDEFCITPRPCFHPTLPDCHSDPPRETFSSQLPRFNIPRPSRLELPNHVSPVHQTNSTLLPLSRTHSAGSDSPSQPRGGGMIAVHLLLNNAPYQMKPILPSLKLMHSRVCIRGKVVQQRGFPRTVSLVTAD